MVGQQQAIYVMKYYAALEMKTSILHTHNLLFTNQVKIHLLKVGRLTHNIKRIYTEKVVKFSDLFFTIFCDKHIKHLEK